MYSNAHVYVCAHAPGSYPRDQTHAFKRSQTCTRKQTRASPVSARAHVRARRARFQAHARTHTHAANTNIIRVTHCTRRRTPDRMHTSSISSPQRPSRSPLRSFLLAPPRARPPGPCQLGPGGLGGGRRRGMCSAVGDTSRQCSAAGDASRQRRVRAGRRSTGLLPSQLRCRSKLRRKSCCGPITDPGRTMRSQPMASFAPNPWCWCVVCGVRARVCVLRIKSCYGHGMTEPERATDITWPRQYQGRGAAHARTYDRRMRACTIEVALDPSRWADASKESACAMRVRERASPRAR